VWNRWETCLGLSRTNESIEMIAPNIVGAKESCFNLVKQQTLNPLKSHAQVVTRERQEGTCECP